MDMQKIESSNISEVGYDAETWTLKQDIAELERKRGIAEKWIKKADERIERQDEKLRKAKKLLRDIQMQIEQTPEDHDCEAQRLATEIHLQIEAYLES
ncbi:MAG: hypothetical protein ACE5I1_11900 [bacterium]